MAKFRVLIAGAGGAGKTVAKCMAEDGRAEPVAFFEPVAGQLEKVAKEFPEALSGADYPELLAKAEPDVVVVAGPDHLHAEQAILALERGCHVLIEKPMATTVADTHKLLEAEAKSGKQIMVDFTMRYSHPWSTMARAAREGQVGPVFFLQGNYIHDMWDYYTPKGAYYTPWRVDKKNPQNILCGGGCHALDLMLWVMQDVPVVEVFGQSNQLSQSDFPGHDCFLVSLQFDNGVIGKVFATSGCNGAPFGSFLEVYGPDGTLSEGKLLRRGQDDVELEDPSGLESAGGHGWPGAVDDFLSTLEGKIENPIPSVMGARNAAICEAAIISGRGGGAGPRGQAVEWFK